VPMKMQTAVRRLGIEITRLVADLVDHEAVRRQRGKSLCPAGSLASCTRNPATTNRSCSFSRNGLLGISTRREAIMPSNSAMAWTVPKVRAPRARNAQRTAVSGWPDQ